jgi:hexosaminidase
MTPGSPLYFSEQPDKNSLPAVYHYSLIPKSLSNAEAKYIIGAQGNLWTERIPTEERADNLYMPRMTALAEVLWTGKDDYTSYLERLKIHYKRLDVLHVNYRLPDLPLLDNYAFTDSSTLSFPKPPGDLIIRYTLDGTLPGLNSTELKEGLSIKQSVRIRLAAFKDERRGDIYDLNFNKQDLAKAEAVINTSNGLICKWYKRSFDSTTLISGVSDGTFNVSDIIVPAHAEAPAFTLQYRGYIDVPEEGIYTFYLTSDDGSVLKIAGREVVNNDGMHAPRERNGQVALEKGLHGIALDFIEGGGGYTLKLQYSKNGSEPQDIPAGWFKN